MNTDTLIIPLDSHTSELLRTELSRPENSRVERASKTAHLISLDTLRRLDSSELNALRGGTLLHRPLEVFRQHVDRMGKVLRDENAIEAIVDPLFTVTSPLWVTTLNVSRVIIAHCGREHLLEELANRGCHHHDALEFVAADLLSGILGVIPSTCEVIIARADQTGVPALLQNKVSTETICGMPEWESTCVTTDRPQGSFQPDTLWVALDLLQSHCDFRSPSECIDFRENYRVLERIILETKVNNSNSHEILHGKLKSYGEYHEPKVRPLGRRLRYAMGMLFNGRIPWKYGSSSKS